MYVRKMMQENESLEESAGVHKGRDKANAHCKNTGQCMRFSKMKSPA